MRIIKDFISNEDKLIALRVLNRLKSGDRVFGVPAEGLKQTLKKIEDAHAEEEKNKGALDFIFDDSEYRSYHSKLKAGINGEETLAEYFERIVKYDEKLQDIIVFASLSDPDQSSTEWISDSDFIAVYGNNILILDAKNINTNPELPIYLDGDNLVTVGGALLIELHPSIFIWKNVFRKNNCSYTSIHGCTVIVNKRGACVWKNQDWHKSEVKPLHISELVKFLHDWIKDKEPETNLSLLTTLAKMQIKKEGSGLDLNQARKKFGI